MSFLIQISGLFSGVFARTLVPYFRKLKQGKILKFDRKYLYTAMGSVVLSAISVLLIIPQFKMEEIPVLSFAEGLKIFCTAFAFGFGWNSLINEGPKWLGKTND